MNISSEVNPAGSELERNIIDFEDVSSKIFCIAQKTMMKVTARIDLLFYYLSKLINKNNILADKKKFLYYVAVRHNGG
jgi:hypothetical protein